MIKRLALCVGINDYPGTGADLHGCVNDANDWGDLLHATGHMLTMLLDEAATKAAVVANLEHMVSQARFGDRIVFTYSGHGSWVPDRDGDEADGRDECLVLHDYASGGLLTDDEMFTIFSKRRLGVRVYVFSDSCHSGSVHRFIGLGDACPSGQPRFLPPTHFLETAELARAERVQDIPARGVSRPGTALISGCADTEYSYDAVIDGRPCGAFSAAAMSTYSPGQGLATWYRKIRTILPSSPYPQTPQLAASTWQKRWTL